MKQKTLIIIKPDAIARGTVGYAYAQLETLKLDVLAAKAVRPSRELTEEHYQHLKGRPFFEELVQHLTGKIHGTNYVLVFVLYGEQAIDRVREITGATDPEQADPRSIRGSLGRTKTSGLMENILHASANEADYEREAALWFKPEDILEPVNE